VIRITEGVKPGLEQRFVSAIPVFCRWILRGNGAFRFCPKGAIGLSLGFQPQVPVKERIRPEGAVDRFSEHEPRRRAECAPRNLPPFSSFVPHSRNYGGQAGRARFFGYLGLKSQAEIYCPFGAETKTASRIPRTPSLRQAIGHFAVFIEELDTRVAGSIYIETDAFFSLAVG